VIQIAQPDRRARLRSRRGSLEEEAIQGTSHIVEKQTKVVPCRT
jgi:hypothetical protein